MKMRKNMAIALAATMLTLVGCGSTSSDASKGSTKGEISALSSEEDAGASEESTVETAALPSYPAFCDTQISGLQLGMTHDEVDAVMGDRLSAQLDYDYAYEYGYEFDEISLFGKNFSLPVVVCCYFDQNDGRLYEVTVCFNVHLNINSETKAAHVGGGGYQDAENDAAMLLEGMTELFGEPTGSLTQAGTTKTTWEPSDLKADPKLYRIESSISSLRLYVYFTDRERNYVHVEKLRKELRSAIEGKGTTTEDATIDDIKLVGDSVSLATLERMAEKVLDAHIDEPCETKEEKIRLLGNVITDLESSGFVFLNDDAYGENGISIEAFYTSFNKFLDTPISVSDVDGLTLTEVGGKLYEPGSIDLSFGFLIEDREEPNGDLIVYGNLIKYFIDNDYIVRERTDVSLESLLKRATIPEEDFLGKYPISHLRDETFDEIDVTPSYFRYIYITFRIGHK